MITTTNKRQRLGKVWLAVCEHCGQDIEGLAPYRKGEWRDRGNNWTCPTPEGDMGLVHSPTVLPAMTLSELHDYNRKDQITMETTTETMQRLEYLRGELRAERISYGELAELQIHAENGDIDPGDVELLEAAGVEENAAAPEPVGEQAHRSMESQQRRDLIATVLRNSAHANLSIATCQLLANAIHAAVVAPLESKSNNHQALVDALSTVRAWLISPATDATTILEMRELVSAALAAVEGEK